jgi:hypothetical protein
MMAVLIGISREEVREMRDTQTTVEKLQYISDMTSQLLRLSDELNLSTLSYLFRMARLEAETAELTASPSLEDRQSPARKSH